MATAKKPPMPSKSNKGGKMPTLPVNKGTAKAAIKAKGKPFGGK